MAFVRLIGIYKACDVVMEGVSALPLKNALFDFNFMLRHVIMLIRKRELHHKIKKNAL